MSFGTSFGTNNAILNFPLSYTRRIWHHLHVQESIGDI